MQNRSVDYREKYDPEIVNHHDLHYFPAGVYQGFSVAADGIISAGILMTRDGVKIEENTPVQTVYGDDDEYSGVPQGDTTYKRKDLIVCYHAYQDVKDNQAKYRVILGTPASEPVYPAIPDNSVVLAYATMDIGGTAYESINHAGPPDVLFNCVKDGANCKITDGNYAAFKASVDLDNGQLDLQILAGGTIADDEQIEWPDAVFSIDGDGLLQLNDLAGIGRTDETVYQNALDAAALDLDVNNHIESTSTYEASLVGLTDADGNYTAENVEAALAESHNTKLSTTGDTLTGALNAQNINVDNGRLIGPQQILECPMSALEMAAPIRDALDNEPWLQGEVYWTDEGEYWSGGGDTACFLDVALSFETIEVADGLTATPDELLQCKIYYQDSESGDVEPAVNLMYRNLKTGAGGTYAGTLSNTSLVQQIKVRTYDFSSATIDQDCVYWLQINHDANYVGTASLYIWFVKLYIGQTVLFDNRPAT